jgi:hypothetical protein
MGWNTACVHRLAGFEAARAWHDKVKPIRGNKENIRPYGSRRHHVMADIHMPDENTVHLRYYGSVLVEWRSNDTYSVYRPKYMSAFVPDNICYFLPLSGQSFVWNKGRMFYADGVDKYELPRDGSLEFQFVGGKSFLLNAPVAYNYRVKRGALKKILPRYEAFMSWAQVVLAVTDYFSQEETEPAFERFAIGLGYASSDEYKTIWNKEITAEERDAMWDERYAREALPFGYGYNDWRRGFGFNTVACEKIREMILGGEPSDWVDILNISAMQAGSWTWSPTQGRKFSPEKCLDWMKQLLYFLHRHEVFDRIRLPKGTMPSRTNTKFFRENHYVPRKLRLNVDKSI